MDPLRAVLLDAGGTLIHPDHRFILDRLAEEGVPADVGDYEVARRQADAAVGDILRSDDPGNDQTRIRTWFANLLTGLGLPESRLGAVAEAIKARHADANLWVRPVPGTREMLESLRGAGLRLAVISNADGRVADYLDRAGLADLFEFILDSALEGVEKPDPRIFRTALDRLGIEAAEAVYVGDTWPVDVVGARRAGIRPVYLADADRAIPEDTDGVIRIHSILELPAALGLDGAGPAPGIEAETGVGETEGREG
jgi:HAD superfamily hydrolase (TIGR01549 family)